MADRRLRVSKAGNIAEAALEIHNVMQAAQDAADKAASDAKDAQDKLDAAQKESDALKAEADKLKEESDKLKAEADKLKSEVESLKNTTTTKPAPTTTAKVQSDADKKVVDDYVAALLNDSDSELNKLLKALCCFKRSISALINNELDAVIVCRVMACGYNNTCKAV